MSGQGSLCPGEHLCPSQGACSICCLCPRAVANAVSAWAGGWAPLSPRDPPALHQEGVFPSCSSQGAELCRDPPCGADLPGQGLALPSGGRRVPGALTAALIWAQLGVP